MTKSPRYGAALVSTLYILFLLAPIYWLVNMSFKTNAEITGAFSLWPANPTLRNYTVIFTDPAWYSGYINSIIYVALNTVISVSVALPAGLRLLSLPFLGDKHLFFWLLTNRMAPPAVFALPFFQLYSAFGLIDTHIAVALAHCLFNVPLAVWILEGFMSGVPKEIDETPISTVIPSRLLREDLHAADRLGHRGRRLLLLHVLLGRTTAGPHADHHRRQADRRDHDADRLGFGHGLGVLAAAGVLTLIPGALVIYFVRNYIAKGFALGGSDERYSSLAGRARHRCSHLCRGRGPSRLAPAGQGRRRRLVRPAHSRRLDGLVVPGALFFMTIAFLLALMAVWESAAPAAIRASHSALRNDARGSSVHLAARFGIYSSRMVGADRRQSVVGSGSLARLRAGRVQAGLSQEEWARRGAGSL